MSNYKVLTEKNFKTVNKENNCMGKNMKRWEWVFQGMVNKGKRTGGEESRITLKRVTPLAIRDQEQLVFLGGGAE